MNMEQARQEARRLRDERDALLRGEPLRPDLTLRQALDWYEALISTERRLASWKGIKANLDRFLAAVGDVPVRGITKADVERFFTIRSRAVRAATANSDLRDVKRLFNALVDAEYVDANPARRMKLHRWTPTPCRLPSSLEVERTLSACPPRLRLVVLALAATGARLSEVLRMDWSDVDFTAGTVILRRTKVKDELVMPMVERLKAALWTANFEAGTPTTGPVFSTRNGTAWDKGVAAHDFRKVTDRLGWPWLKLKTFRKLVATTIWRDTGNMRNAQKMLGHGSSRITEIYVQGEMEARSAGVAAMDRFLAGSPATPTGDGVNRGVNGTPTGESNVVTSEGANALNDTAGTRSRN